MAFDIGTFSDAYSKANEEGRCVAVPNPDNGNPCGITVRLAGPYSKRQEDANRALNDWLRENPHASQDDRKKAVTHRFACGLISWEWEEGVTFRGSVPECTVDNVKRVMTEAQWFGDFIAAQTGVSQGFIKG